MATLCIARIGTPRFAYANSEALRRRFRHHRRPVDALSIKDVETVEEGIESNSARSVG
jgi:hypothetical protein